MTGNRKETKARYTAERGSLLLIALATIPYGLSIFQSHYMDRDMSGYLGMVVGVFWAGVGALALFTYIYLGLSRHDKSQIDFVTAKELKIYKELTGKRDDDVKTVVDEEKQENMEDAKDDTETESGL